jgi:hypothetical protein
MAQGDLEGVIIAQEQARIKALSDEFDRRCKQAASGIKQVRLATLNGVTFQQISKMLNTNGHQDELRKGYIPSIAIENPDKFAEEVLFFLCDLCGREHPPKKHKLTAGERLKQLEEVLREMQMDKHPKVKDLLP